MDVLVSDLRLALRMMVRRPAFAATAVLALAIGLGVNAVAFSAVNAFLFRPRAGFDVEGAGRVITSGGPTGEEGLSVVEYERLAAGTAGMLQTAVEGRTALAWIRSGRSETVWALLVSDRYFPILEPQPLIGRLLTSGRDAGTPTAIVSERFWRERLAAADLGTLRLTLNGVDTPVIGVLPSAFDGPGGLYAPQIWVPFEARRTFQLSERLEQPDTRWLGMIGRVAPGTSIAEVDARLQAAAAAVVRDHPRTHARFAAHFALMRERVPEVRAIAWLAAAGMAAVGLVLLIACFNVANLLLARAIDRQRETGIRAAVGASQWRIVRQHMTEGLVLSAFAAAGAVIVAMWSQQLAGAFAIPIPEPQRVNLSPDGRVIGFIALAAIAAGIIPAIAPALQSVRLDLVRALSANGHGWREGRTSTVRRALLVVQIAGSTAFLVVAALFVRSFAWSGQADPGFETERAIVMTLDPSSQGYEADRARLTLDRFLERVNAVPGIRRAAIATELPLYIGFPRLTEVSETAEPCTNGGCPRVDTYGIGTGFFETMGVPMVKGAEFDAHSSSDGMIVNEPFADRWFPNRNAIGQTVLLGPTGERRVVVGVSRNTIQRGFAEQPHPAIYLPMAQRDYERPISIVMQTAMAPAPLVRLVADALHELDPRLAAESLMTMEERLQLPRWPMRAGSLFFGTCGALALMLATIGLAAILAHAMVQRTREFGIRLAIGATASQLIAEVLRSAFAVVGPGVVLGIVVAALVARGVRVALVGVDVSGPSTYLAVAVLQGVIALLACLAPARRAARLDPIGALRAD
jgi:predicted permease